MKDNYKNNSLSQKDLQTIWHTINKYKLQPSKYIMNSNDYTDIVNWVTRRKYLIYS